MTSPNAAVVPWTAGTPAQRRGAALMDDICDVLDRFVIFPSDAQRDAVAAWTMATHARDYDQGLVWNAFGILGLLATSPNAGKTQALTVVAHLGYGDDPTLEMNPSPRGMIQAINEEHTPLYIDNLDAWWKRSASSPDAKAIILAYQYGSRKRILNAKQNLYEATAISALDANLRNNPEMHDVMTRMIAVHMRQKRPDQKAETWNERLHAGDAKDLRLALSDWGKGMADHFALAWPATPEGLTDGRAIQIWTSLLAVGEACGPDWTGRIWRACRALALSDAVAMQSEPVMSATERLHAALAEVLDPREELVATRDLIPRLQHSSYQWMVDKPLKPASMELAAKLRPRGISPVAYWHREHGSIQGYRFADLRPLLPSLLDELDNEDGGDDGDPAFLPL